MPRGGSRHLSPDAVANVVHGYAHISDKTADEVVAVKPTKNTKKRTNQDDPDEDPFFHALLHNNDDDSRVVKNVVNKEFDEPIDEEMFGKLIRKVFHGPQDCDQSKHEDKCKVTYGLREFIEDSSLME